ncbi:MAG: hypothetical protein GYB55_11220 [Cytophagales bacterium]|jgi:hypothetical protein|nr:hypothetical protein [Cytophagales bacterium]
MKKLPNLFFKYLTYSLLILMIGCGEDFEPNFLEKPDLTILPGEETQQVLIGQEIVYDILLTGEDTKFTSLTVILSYGDATEEYKLVDNEIDDFIETPFSEKFSFQPTQEMVGKPVTLQFSYMIALTTNSGGEVFSEKSKTINVLVEE